MSRGTDSPGLQEEIKRQILISSSSPYVLELNSQVGDIAQSIPIRLPYPSIPIVPHPIIPRPLALRTPNSSTRIDLPVRTNVRTVFITGRRTFLLKLFDRPSRLFVVTSQLELGQVSPVLNVEVPLDRG